mgnify:FL=1
MCKIIAEEPVAKGVRRIAALTGPKAVHKIRATEDLLKHLVQLLKTPQPEDLPRRIETLQEELRTMKKQLSQQVAETMSGKSDELFASAEQVGGVRIIAHHAELASREVLRELVDQLRNRKEPVAILLATVEDGKVALTAAVSKDLIARGVNASDAVRTAAKVVGGGGGGRPDLAEAGGKNPEKLTEALAAGADYYRSQLS